MAFSHRYNSCSYCGHGHSDCYICTLHGSPNSIRRSILACMKCYIHTHPNLAFPMDTGARILLHICSRIDQRHRSSMVRLCKLLCLVRECFHEGRWVYLCTYSYYQTPVNLLDSAVGFFFDRNTGREGSLLAQNHVHMQTR